MKRVHAVYLVLLFVLFLYGFTAGSYRLFPFYQIAYLKNTVFSAILDRPDPVPPPPAMGVEVLETDLQRLLVKRVPLPHGPEAFTGGGALARADDILYVVTSKGSLAAFDLGELAALEFPVDNVPMNYDALMQSRMRYEITVPWFRVSGMYAEESAGGHTLFVSHNHFDQQRGCVTFNVSRLGVEIGAAGPTPEGGWQTIFTASPCMYPLPTEGIDRHPFSGHISGGSMIGYDEQSLLVTIGDFTYDGYLREAWAQDLSNPYGKILLMNKETGAFEIYASGIRNSMGLFLDSHGTLWAPDSGPQGGCELNVVVRNGNYGWPIESFGINYSTNPWPPSSDQGRHDRFRQPHFSWMPSVTPTNLVRIENDAGTYALWTGDLIIGTLTDRSLRRLRLDSNDRVIYDERIGLGERVRDMTLLKDGTVVLLTDATGQLVFLGDGGPVFEPTDEGTMNRIVALERFGRLVEGATRSSPTFVRGEDLFTQRCASCHSVEPRNMIGPHLARLPGRMIGGVDGYSYSDALAGQVQPWSRALLHEFLLSPESVFPGSKMPPMALTASEADSILSYVERAQP